MIRVDILQDLHFASVLMYTDSYGDIGWSGSCLRLASIGSLSGGHKSIHKHPLLIFADKALQSFIHGGFINPNWGLGNFIYRGLLI